MINSVGSDHSVYPESEQTDLLAVMESVAALRRILRRDSVQGFLKRIGQGTVAVIQVVACDGELLFHGGPAGSDLPDNHLRAGDQIYLATQPVAKVLVSGDERSTDAIAMLVARWLQDLLQGENELSSLTQEVVHIYEELHLLYDLGAALGGVMDLEATCILIVQKLLRPLNACMASIRLSGAGSDQPIAQAHHTNANGTRVNKQARAVALLQVPGEALGSVLLEGKIDGTEFNSDDLKLLEGVAAVAAPTIRNAQLYAAARHEADIDALTRVANHRRLQERIAEEFDRARRFAHPLSLVMVDVDNFKLFNDVHGHPIGDYILQTVAETLRSAVRSVDTVGRYGGDEFLIILPETDRDRAVQIGERILAAVGALETMIAGQRLPLALSIGIASYPEIVRTKQELIAHADSAMYESKSSGGGMLQVANRRRSDWLSMQSTTYGVLEGLVHTVDAKDHYTHEHSEVVTEAALLLAQHMNLGEETQRALRIAGLLHDIGKIGIPDYILKKPGKLTADEYEIMKGHVVLSELIIKDVPNLDDVLDAVGHHHEQYDGSGYPSGKQKEQIPLVGRIMAVADAYSAMSMDRPYRKAMDWPTVRGELERGAGKQFDPTLVEIFIAAMEAGLQKEVATTPAIHHDQLNLDLTPTMTKEPYDIPH
ncbi:MAG: hypothetical protein NVS4B8_11250 [Herpetosiphon sp.]